MKKFILLLLLITSRTLISSAQLHDNNWISGYNYDLSTPEAENVILNFDNNQVNIEHLTTNSYFHNASSTFSDSLGNLLFYTDGCEIFNKNFEIMENGNEINPGEIYQEDCVELERGYITAPQSILSFRQPGNDSMYYIFHKRIVVDYDMVDVAPITRYTTTLFYSTINMNANDGLGRVVEKNVPIINDTLTNGGFTAVKHANNRAWWLTTKKYRTSNRFYTILFNEQGVDTMFQQFINDSILENLPGSSYTDFTPDGSKYVNFNKQFGLIVMDFDRSTGLLSNPRYGEVENSTVFSGLAISPSSRFAYGFLEQHIYQYDLEAEDLTASRELVAEFDGFEAPFATHFRDGQLAPDCKIYVRTTGASFAVHVIHNPDEKGVACNVEQHAIILDYPLAGAFPNYPNYRLDASGAPPCTQVISSTATTVAPASVGLRVFPNPARRQVHVRFQAVPPVSLPAQSILQVVAMDGRVVLSTAYDLRQAPPLDVRSLPPGMYSVVVHSGREFLGSQKLVVQR